MITPDTKDWTWVVGARCPECDVDVRELSRADIAPQVRALARRWQTFLASNDNLRERPDDATWAPLEYAAHVRDVLRLYDERLVLMLDTNDPLYPNWDQNAAAEGYLALDPQEVGREIVAAAEILATRFERVMDWTRPGRRSDGARFTVASFARYFLHDPLHHLWDVGAA